MAVREHAYAPYSNFRVGACLLTKSGKRFVGCNVENASYGLCCCAERSAVSAAVAAGEREFVGIVVVTASSPPSSPCGMCRQVLVEFNPQLPALLVNPQGEEARVTMAELFPAVFDHDLLKTGQDQPGGDGDSGDEP